MKVSISSFAFSGQLPRVVFGAGSLQLLGREIEQLGATRALVLCTPEQRAGAERVAAASGRASSPHERI